MEWTRLWPFQVVGNCEFGTPKITHPWIDRRERRTPGKREREGHTEKYDHRENVAHHKPSYPAMAYHSSRHSNIAHFRVLIPSCVPFFAFLSFTIFLLYKVDIYISQSRRVVPVRHTIEVTQTPQIQLLSTPFSFNEETRVVSNGTFDRYFEITWGDDRAKILEDGELLTLSLDKRSGSGFQSRDEFLFGKLDMQIKLVAGNSAGTVTAYYLSSEGSAHDEIDFEFLGNSSGDPYTLHTNVFSQGKGNREQQFFLWFDPTSDFHTYSIIWNPNRILFYVDGTPIREFKNSESIGVPFPKDQPMRLYSSLWNGEEWATQGGRVKTDWSRAPFTASYRNFSAESCIWSSGQSSCKFNVSSEPWFREKFNTAATRKLKWVQKYHMIYNYCVDVYRFPEGLAPECKIS